MTLYRKQTGILRNLPNPTLIHLFILGSLSALLFGADLSVSLLVIGITLVQVWSGQVIFQYLNAHRPITLARSLSYGFILGSNFSTISAQLFLHTPLRLIGWMLPFLITLTLKHKTKLLGNQSGFHAVQLQISSGEVCFASCMSLLFLSQDYPWCFPVLVISLIFAFGFSVLASEKSHLDLLIKVIATTLFILVVFALTPTLRGQYWWILSDDFQFFEAMQRSFSRFGLMNDWGTLNQYWYSYHTLAYGWIGNLDKISGAPTWVVINRIVPVIIAFFLSCSIVGLGQLFNISGTLIGRLVLSTYPFLFFYSYTSPSSALGQIALVGIATYWIDNFKSGVRLTAPVFGLSMIIVLFYTKMSNLPTAIVLLAILVAVRFIANRTQGGWIGFGTLIFFVGSILLMIFFVLLQPSNMNSLNFISPFGFAYERVGSLAGITSRLQRYFVAVLILLRYLLLPILASWIAYLLFKNKDRILAIILPSMTVYTIFLSVLTGRGPNGYFVLSSLNLIYILSLIVVAKVAIKFHSVAHFLLIIAIGACTGVGQMKLAERFNGGDFYNIALSSFLQSGILTVLVLVIASEFSVRLRQNSRTSEVRIWLSRLLLCLVGASLGTGIIALRHPSHGPEVSVAESPLYIGNEAERDVGMWLKANTSNSSLMASNHFCQNSCIGKNWYKERPETAGSNFILPIYSERRFLIQGTRFVGSTTRVGDLMATVIDFAEDPSLLNVIRLRKLGVDFYILDLYSTTYRHWSTFGPPLFRNSQFLVFDLNDKKLHYS